MFLTRYNLHIVHDCCRLSAQSNTTRQRDGKKALHFEKHVQCALNLFESSYRIFWRRNASQSRGRCSYILQVHSRQGRSMNFIFSLLLFVFFYFKFKITTCNRRFSSSTRRFPPRDEGRTFAIKDEIKRQVQEMLAANVIKPSLSPWASPVVLVEKKGGEQRFCVVLPYYLAHDVRRLLSTYHPTPWPTKDHRFR